MGDARSVSAEGGEVLDDGGAALQAEALLRRFPFTLALLPCGELVGTVEVKSRAAGGFLVYLDAVSHSGAVVERAIWTKAQIKDATGVELEEDD